MVIPAYNEALIIEQNLHILCDYLESLSAQYRWEILLVNDGSRDNTGLVAEAVADVRSHITVLHHSVNRGLGQALKTGFEHCQGRYVLTLDLDLSYAPEHIALLLEEIQSKQANVVVTSPYMRGGRVSNVPWARRLLSVWANRFLSVAAKRDVKTLTGMVRAYDADFLKSLSFRATGMDVNPEVLYKAKMLKATVTEVPAHLHWRTAAQPDTARRPQARRKSSMKILRQSWSVFFYGFAFRPVMFFVIPGLLLLVGSGIIHLHVLLHCVAVYRELLQTSVAAEPTQAISQAFLDHPHDFLLGGVTLILSIQLLSLGLLAMQMKHYFEESFHLGTQTYRAARAHHSADELR
ncbi:MAG: glycosyltransferase family 2 protein [Leptolyngbya sp. SIO4C1]|nr:glycosyltransferase family 2 protein [Leptolyngbya sp. SIO4C1]